MSFRVYLLAAAAAAAVAIAIPVAASSQGGPQTINLTEHNKGSTFNYIAESTDWDPAHLAGRNIRIGIREHGMGAIMNGMAYHGGIRPSGAEGSGVDRNRTGARQ